MTGSGILDVLILGIAASGAWFLSSWIVVPGFRWRRMIPRTLPRLYPFPQGAELSAGRAWVEPMAALGFEDAGIYRIGEWRDKTWVRYFTTPDRRHYAFVSFRGEVKRVDYGFWTDFEGRIRIQTTNGSDPSPPGTHPRTISLPVPWKATPDALLALHRAACERARAIGIAPTSHDPADIPRGLELAMREYCQCEVQSGNLRACGEDRWAYTFVGSYRTHAKLFASLYLGPFRFAKSDEKLLARVSSRLDALTKEPLDPLGERG